jgi:hypothetical protein
MSRRAATLEKANALSDDQITSRKEWLIVRQKLLEREKELTRLCHQVSVERRALAWAKVEKKDDVEVSEDTGRLGERSDGAQDSSHQTFEVSLDGPGRRPANRGGVFAAATP